MKLPRCVIGPATLVYRLLLGLLPGSFRRDYGEELIIVFRDLVQDAYFDGGILNMLSVSLGAMWDVLRAAVREHWQEILLQKAKPRLSGQCTPRVEDALRLAYQEARLVEDHCCSSGHILLGLLREGGGMAAQVLEGLGITVNPLRDRITLLAETSVPSIELDEHIDRRQQVLELAQTEASKLGHRFVGTEHVLLGLLSSDEGLLKNALQGVGSSAAQVREATLSRTKVQLMKLKGNEGGLGRAFVLATKVILVALLLFALAATATRVFGQGSPSVVAPGRPDQSQKSSQGNPNEFSKALHVEEVQIPLKGNRSLQGTLILPKSAVKVPAILMIPGYANPDEGAPSNHGTAGSAGFVLGRYLAEQGFAVLRVPFGEGSAGNEPTLSVEDLASRALECAEYLKNRREIEPTCIGILGHSAGGGIATVAAARSNDIAFLIVAGSPVEPVESTVFGLIDSVLRTAGASQQERAAGRKLQEKVFASIAGGATPDDIRPELEELLRLVYAQLPKEQIQRGGKDFDGFVETATDKQLKTLTSPWFRSLLGYDPPATMEKLRCPALILFAEKDQKIEPSKSSDIAKAALKKSGQTDWAVEIITGADHSFGLPEQGAAAPEGGTQQQFSHDFLEIVKSWLSNHIRAKSSKASK